MVESNNVTECMFMCLMHSKTKQTEMLAFGVERLIALPCKETGGLCLKSSEGFQQSTLKDHMRDRCG